MLSLKASPDQVLAALAGAGITLLVALVAITRYLSVDSLPRKPLVFDDNH